MTGFLQVVRHSVERPGKIADFVFGVDTGAPFQLASAMALVVASKP